MSKSKITSCDFLVQTLLYASKSLDENDISEKQHSSFDARVMVLDITLLTSALHNDYETNLMLMEQMQLQEFLKQQGMGKILLSSLHLVTHLIFFSLVLLVKTIWADINYFLSDILGLNFPWLVIIVLLAATELIFQIQSFREEIKLFNTTTLSATLKGILRNILPMTIYSALIYVLLDEMGNERDIILYTLRDVFPWILLVLSVTGFLLLQPIATRQPRVSTRSLIMANVLLILLLISSLLMITNSSGFRFETVPYLQSPGEDRMSIMWVTSTDAVSWVEYGETTALGMTAYASSVLGLLPVTQVHKVMIQGLQPGTTYHYKVISKEVKSVDPNSADFGSTIESELKSFNTLDTTKDAYSFFVFSDIHEQEEIYQMTMDYATTTPDFVVMNGDHLNHVDSKDQLLEQFIDPVASALQGEIPFVLARGNHETRGPLARDFWNYVDTPTGMPYYSFDHGPVHFTVLDTGEDKEDDDVEYSGLVNFTQFYDEQYQWLQAEVLTDAYQQATFRVVLAHIPLNGFLFEDEFTFGREYLQQWATLLNDTGADLIISGHMHGNILFEPGSELNPFDFVQVYTGGYYTDDQTLFQVDVSGTQISIRSTLIAGDDQGTVLISHTIN
ncbi:MAG: metallophosphoesterase family protein [Candidatus Heimdallarchaeota archaeon]|nr:metallophosphoesterase family protein [Candidatus Heimdallarchaeota archaeon]